MKVRDRLRQLLPYLMVFLLGAATVWSALYYSPPRPQVLGREELPPRRGLSGGLQLERVTIHHEPGQNTSLSMILTNNSTTPTGVVGWRFRGIGGDGSLLVSDERIVPPGVSVQRLLVPEVVFDSVWDLSDEEFQAHWYLDTSRENLTVLTWERLQPLPSLDGLLSARLSSDVIVFGGWFAGGAGVVSSQPDERLVARWRVAFGGGGGLDELTVVFYEKGSSGAEREVHRESFLVAAIPGEQTAFSFPLVLPEEPDAGALEYYATLGTLNSVGRSTAVSLSIGGETLGGFEPPEVGKIAQEPGSGVVPGSVRMANCSRSVGDRVIFDLDVNAILGSSYAGDGPSVLVNGQELPSPYSVDGEVWRLYSGLSVPLSSAVAFDLLPFPSHLFGVELEIAVPRFRPSETQPSCPDDLETLTFVGVRTQTTPTVYGAIVTLDGVFQPGEGYLDFYMALYVGASTLLLVLSLAKREGRPTKRASLPLLGALASAVVVLWLGIGHGSALITLVWAAVLFLVSLPTVAALAPLQRRIPEFLQWVFLLVPLILLLSALLDGLPDFYRSRFILWTVVANSVVVVLLLLRPRLRTLWGVS